MDKEMRGGGRRGEERGGGAVGDKQTGRQTDKGTKNQTVNMKGLSVDRKERRKKESSSKVKVFQV